MIKNVLEHIGGIANYGIISIFLFFACFLGAVLWTLTRKRPYLEHMKQLPLADDDGETAHVRSQNPPPASP
jgi:cytochrome c oxidase cbb3-type subunit 4